MALEPGVLAELEAIVGREHVRHEAGEVAPYARDATPLFSSPPDAVLSPAPPAEAGARGRGRHEAGGVAPSARDAAPLFSSPPDAVVFPAHTEEVAAVLRLAT